MDQQPLPPGSASSGPSAQYEFSAEQNTTLAALAGKMRFVGAFLMVVGVLYLLLGGLVILGAISGATVPAAQAKGDGVIVAQQRLGFAHSIGYIVGGLIYLFMGMWTGNGATAFRRIVDTQGSDIRHLMEAVTNLRKLYTLQFWLILIGLIVLVLAIFAVAMLVISR